MSRPEPNRERCLARRATPAGTIEVRADGNLRSLWFADGILQSAILVNQADVLPQAANRAMLAHLLFGQTPERILLAGCGGGAIGRWFDARAPGSTGCAIEISTEVADLAREYFEFPPRSGRWQLEIGDVRTRIRQRPPQDFILVDLATDGLTPDWVSSAGFLQDCQAALTESGVLTINLLVADGDALRRALGRIRRQFVDKTVCLPVPGHTNIIVIAFMQAPDPSPILAQLPTLTRRWGLEFEQFLQAMQAANPPASSVFR